MKGRSHSAKVTMTIFELDEEPSRTWHVICTGPNKIFLKGSAVAPSGDYMLTTTIDGTTYEDKIYLYRSMGEAWQRYDAM